MAHEEAKEWNRETGNRWSIKSNGRFQAQLEQTSKVVCDPWERIVSCEPFKEAIGPEFDTEAEARDFITSKIEKEIELHWFAKSRLDFDLC